MCTALLVELLELPLAKEWGDMLVDRFANKDRFATRVKLQVYVCGVCVCIYVSLYLCI